MRLPRRGLAARFALALIATSVATLIAATLTLVPPMEHRIERDRLADLRRLAVTVRPELRTLDVKELVPGSRVVRDIVVALRRRTGGRIAIYDSAGHDLARANIEGPDPYATELEEARDHAAYRRGVVGGEVAHNSAIAVTSVRAINGRLTLVLAVPLNDLHAAAAAVRRALPLAAAVGLGTAVALAILVSTGLLGRLERLLTDARALGDEGLGHPVTVSGKDEVAELAGALETLRVRLIEAETARQAFIATASHELRTPLASLQATLELLQEEMSRPGADVAAARRRAEDALRHTHRLTSLSTDLLDLSRLDGDVPLQSEPVELREIADAVAAERRDDFGAENRAVDVTGAPGPIHAVADADAVSRILRILLDNARAYGEGRVELEIRRNGSQVLMLVDDEGPGLSETEREDVFSRFVRGSAGASRPGFGLGLAIARGLARAMNGDLAAVAAAEGARFELRLPQWTGDEA